MMRQSEDTLVSSIKSGLTESVKFSITTKSCSFASFIASSVIGILSGISKIGLFSSAGNVIVRAVLSKSFRSVWRHNITVENKIKGDHEIQYVQQT